MESRILAARVGSRGMIKVEGEGTFLNSNALKGAYMEMLRNGVTFFILHLGACELLDSTFVGTLLGLGLRLKEQGSSEINVVKSKPALKDSFRDVGLDRVLIFDGRDDGSDLLKRLN